MEQPEVKVGETVQIRVEGFHLGVGYVASGKVTEVDGFGRLTVETGKKRVYRKCFWDGSSWLFIEVGTACA